MFWIHVASYMLCFFSRLFSLGFMAGGKFLGICHCKAISHLFCSVVPLLCFITHCVKGIVAKFLTNNHFCNKTKCFYSLISNSGLSMWLSKWSPRELPVIQKRAVFLVICQNVENVFFFLTNLDFPLERKGNFRNELNEG